MLGIGPDVSQDPSMTSLFTTSGAPGVARRGGRRRPAELRQGLRAENTLRGHRHPGSTDGNRNSPTQKFSKLVRLFCFS